MGPQHTASFNPGEARFPRDVTMTASTSAQVAAPSRQFTRAQVSAAVIAAGNNPAATDSDIRRLVNIQFHMIAHELGTIDTETLGDGPSIQLLDYFAPKP